MNVTADWVTDDEIDPLVPETARRTSTGPVRADGGRSSRLDAGEIEAPLISEFRATADPSA